MDTQDKQCSDCKHSRPINDFYRKQPPDLTQTASERCAEYRKKFKNSKKSKKSRPGSPQDADPVSTPPPAPEIAPNLRPAGDRSLGGMEKQAQDREVRGERSGYTPNQLVEPSQSPQSESESDFDPEDDDDPMAYLGPESPMVQARNLRYYGAKIQSMAAQLHPLSMSFVTYSASEQEWNELRRHLPDSEPTGTELSCHGVAFRAFKRNSHIVGGYSQVRFKKFLTVVLKPSFNIVDCWHMWEPQFRGTAHNHGIYWCPYAGEKEVSTENQCQTFAEWWEPKARNLARGFRVMRAQPQ